MAGSVGLILDAGMLQGTIIILNFRTDRFKQTLQTLIRLLLEEQSDQGLHCLLFHLHLFDEIPKGLASFLKILVDYSKVFGVRKFRNFMVMGYCFPLGLWFPSPHRTSNTKSFLYHECTPQPLYNIIVGVQVNFRLSYSIRVITRVKCIVI